ncbi:MAG: aldehyde:ferredoxin oxidoreductase [Clostridiaceae bacterium BRH_c20a]|nr:MAG: aldehyde:ferredoxin oxidoreductase [Clostridiaceae bacterium BRH_c20a]
MTSYMGKLLLVNLSEGSAGPIEINPQIQELFVGGKGFGAKILFDMLPVGCDPLGPENIIMFMPGPLTGTIAPGMRGCVVTKSPLTGTFVDSYFGGHFAPEIRYAGYDGLVILGKSTKPCYLWIDDDKVEVKSAEHLWGLDTFEVNERIKDELGDKSVKIASIGPAGEKLVKFALISCEYNRHAGRGGTGAVMGSKHLKAIALRGSKVIKVMDQEAFDAAVARAYKELKGEPAIEGFNIGGTASSIDFANEEHLLPTYNYSQGTFEGADGLNAVAQRKHLWLRDVACAGCPIACSKVGKIRSGRYKGLISDIVEYETAAMVGSNLGIKDTREVIRLVKECDALGLDGISAGGVAGFAIEAFNKRLITLEDTGGLELSFGNADAVAYLFKIIAKREQGLGDTLARGVKEAAEIIGGGAEDFAVHVKALETPAWGPRSVPAMGLAYATADRGGCHQRAFPILYELGGTWKGKSVDRLGLKDKGEIVAYMQNYLAALDTLVKCDFAQYGIKGDTYCSLLSAATGRGWTIEGLQVMGERVWNLIRQFNAREGFERKDDTLPKRFMEEPLPSGPNQGHRITQEDLSKMLDDYYKFREWDTNGIPSEEKLQQLGLGSKDKLCQFKILTQNEWSGENEKFN